MIKAARWWRSAKIVITITRSEREREKNVAVLVVGSDDDNLAMTCFVIVVPVSFGAVIKWPSFDPHSLDLAGWFSRVMGVCVHRFHFVAKPSPQQLIWQLS